MKNMFLGILCLMALSGLVFSAGVYLYPNGATGYSQWNNYSCLSTAEYQCVDESTVNVSDYVYIGTNTSKYEAFEFGNITNATSINYMTVYYYAAQYTLNSTNYNTFKPMVYYNGSYYLGSPITTNATAQYYSVRYNGNPVNGNPWTVSDINNMRAGMASYSANGGSKIYQMRIYVSYS